jgi:hypothetical protein
MRHHCGSPFHLRHPLNLRDDETLPLREKMGYDAAGIAGGWEKYGTAVLCQKDSPFQM